MKKIILMTLAAAACLASCVQDELLDSNPPSDTESAVLFDSYLGRSISTRATVITSETLKGEGFGVNAWYTGLTPFDASSLSDYEVFMNNTKVTHDGTMWSYSPLKYWPNNPHEMLSFVAYAPHNSVTGDDGTVSAHPNITVDGTSLKYTVANEVKDQVDLLWSDSSATDYDGNPYSTIDLEKQTVEDKVMFYFRHALSKISFRVGALIDKVEDDTYDGVLGDNVLASETVIKVKKVVLMGGDDTYDETEGWQTAGGPFHTGGTLNLVDGTWADQTSGQRFVFTAAEHFNADENGEFVLDSSNSNNLNALLNDESYLMIIPQDLTAGGFKIYIEYDVITTDSALTDGTSVVENKITSADAITTINFEQGKQYNINMILGMTSVKFDVEVTDWEEAPVTDSDNPANMGSSTKAITGSGTENDPYVIYTLANLQEMADNINSDASAAEGCVDWASADAHYRQDDDIDFEGGELGDVFGLISTFKGTYDGGGNKLSNFVVSSGNRGFICNNEGTVKNLHGVGEVMSGSLDSPIVSCNYGYVISCSFDGTHSAINSYSGAVVGTNYKEGVVIGCTFDGTYKALDYYTGVIVGNNAGIVVGCYCSGDIMIDSNARCWLGTISGSQYYYDDPYDEDEEIVPSTIGCYTTSSFTITGDDVRVYPTVYNDGAVVKANYHKVTCESSYIYDDGSTHIDGTTVTWESAVTEMNKAIAEAGYDYKYVENTDEATKDSFPYVLVEI